MHDKNRCLTIPFLLQREPLCCCLHELPKFRSDGQHHYMLGGGACNYLTWSARVTSLSDRGPNFLSTLVKEVMKRVGMAQDIILSAIN